MALKRKAKASSGKAKKSRTQSASLPLKAIGQKQTKVQILKFISEETRPYFRDVYDHVVRINEMVENTRELLSTAMEANFSLISISQSDVSRRFAGWAAIIAVPTMIAGFYGMNFKFMPETDWEYGFYSVIIFTAGICLLLYYLFRRSGWL